MRAIAGGALLCLLAACGGQPAPPPGFPSASEGWTLASSSDLPVDGEPENVRKLGLKRARRAVYQGPVALTLTLYEMNSEPASLELIQTWRAVPDTFVIRRDRHFAIAHSPGAPRDKLQAFLAAFDKRLAAPQ
jgi:hypothetical protein